MTKEEAIKLLLESKDNDIKRSLREWEEWDERFFEAIDIAIEALENYDKLAEDLETCLEMYKKKKAEVKALRQNQWIPCSERLPEKGNTAYMTTVDYGEFGRATGQRFFFSEHLGWDDDAVVAWMPLPEPYKEGDAE